MGGLWYWINFSVFPVHELASAMEPRIGVFNAFTGCDTVSSFGRKDKKTAWNTWQNSPEAIDALKNFY